MKKAGLLPIKVALYGMDGRSYKTMAMYLKGPCRGIAEVVDESVAEVDIIDADFATAKEILDSRRQANSPRPIILLSLQILQIEGAIFVKKPVNAEHMSAALLKAKQALESRKKTHEDNERRLAGSLKPALAPVDVQSANEKRSVGQSSSDIAQQKTAANRHDIAASAFLGTVSGIDFNDPAQILIASYDPRNYFLGYVLSAYKIANAERRSLRLNSIWKPLVILPEMQKIWLDADDKQLRVFAGIEQNKLAGNSVNLTPVDSAAFSAGNAQEKLQDIDAFIWKLTIWTSKGRFPAGLDLNRPVYLKRWPNFTRLLMTPDALRIASLLVQNPRSPLDIINVLKVSPQYVFAFISACQSAGLLGHSVRHVDEMIAQEPPKASPKKGLLSKILSKLRG